MFEVGVSAHELASLDRCINLHGLVEEVGRQPDVGIEPLDVACGTDADACRKAYGIPVEESLRGDLGDKCVVVDIIAVDIGLKVEIDAKVEGQHPVGKESAAHLYSGLAQVFVEGLAHGKVDVVKDF